MDGTYPYTVEICGHIEYEISNGQTHEIGGCEIPAEFFQELREFIGRIEAKYPNLF